MKTKTRSWVQELIDLKSEKGELCKAEDVVKFAENPHTSLHKKFQWDDTEAAIQYRLYQARNLMTVAVYYEPVVRKEIPVFVNLKEDRTNIGGGYRSLIDVMDDKYLHQKMLQEAKDVFIYYRNKYAMLTELTELFKNIDNL